MGIGEVPYPKTLFMKTETEVETFNSKVHLPNLTFRLAVSVEVADPNTKTSVRSKCERRGLRFVVQISQHCEVGP